jgi:anti-sigma factor RsiW
MRDKLLDILKNEADISEQEMLNYLEGKLTPEERQSVEERIATSEMLADAEEGLSQLKNKEEINKAVAGLNKQLAQQLVKQRRKRKRRELPNQSLIILSTFIILVLIVIAFVVIYKMQKG